MLMWERNLLRCTANNAGISTAAINVYYHGVLTNSSSIFPGNTVKYNVSGG